MFIEFQVSNFRSFRDLTTFSMRAAPKRDNSNGEHEENVYEIDGLRMLKIKAIFGANASGKSNLAKALGAFRLVVEESVSKEDMPKNIWNMRFNLATDWDEEPVAFQSTFLTDGIRYRYGFEVTNNSISSEWLYIDDSQGEIEAFFRSTPLTIRTAGVYFKQGALFSQQLAENSHEILRSDALFLTGAALNGAHVAQLLREEIRSISVVNGIDDRKAFKLAMAVLDSGSNKDKKFMNDFLCATDIGLTELEVVDVARDFVDGEYSKGGNSEESTSVNKQLFSTYLRYNDDGEVAAKLTVPFNSWASEGSSKLFALSVLFLYTLREGRTLLIDEFDARLHSNLTLKIVNLFNSVETNPKNAQLIFVTHDASLLERADLRRDQIVFVQKDKYGISRITTLIEFKGIRKDASYEKDYLQGRYSGIPYLSRMNWAIKEIFQENGLPETK